MCQEDLGRGRNLRVDGLSFFGTLVLEGSQDIFGYGLRDTLISACSGVALVILAGEPYTSHVRPLFVVKR